MNDPVEPAYPEVLPVDAATPIPPTASRWNLVGLVLAWVLIVALGTFMVVVRMVFDEKKAEAGKDTFGLLSTRMQGRNLVGAKEVFGLGKEKPPDPEAMKVVNTGTVDQRLCYIVLVGEMSGAGKALKELTALEKRLAEKQVPLSPTQEQLLLILGRLYRDYETLRLDGPSVTAAERALLRKELDWFGELALAPNGLPTARQQVVAAVAGGPAALVVGQAQTPDPAARTVVLEPALRTTFTLVGVFLVVFLSVSAGFVLLIVVGVQWLRGKLQEGLHANAWRGGVYAETFALWMLAFVAMLVFGPELVPKEYRAVLSVFAPLLSLAALGWPVLRGVPWRDVRQDVGLTFGRQPVLEPAYGVVCYLMMLPVLGAVLMVMLALLFILKLATEGFVSPEDSFGPTGGAAHPAVEMLVRGGLGQRLLLVLLGAVVAPVVEEIMFRGVLYRHLRDLTGRWHGVVSALVSATVMGFIFAVIHPQGLLGVPGLMMISFALTLAREWRGSLVPGITAHALNNGGIFLLVLLAMAD